MEKDYYAVLGVDEDASVPEIDWAYRTRVAELVPDLFEEDSRTLEEIQEAYSILVDPLRRRAYDRARFLGGRLLPMRGAPVPELLVPGKKPVDLGEISLTESFHTVRPSFEGLMDRLFSNFFDLTRPKAEKIESLTLEILLTSRDVLLGGRARIMIPALAKCPICGGRGGVGPFECWHCAGKGAVVEEYPVMVTYPAGASNYVAEIPLDRFGIRNFCLTVHFKVGE
jgi:molecular chaperone DnaJ